CLVRSLIRILARWVLVAGAHETDREKLIELGHRAQHSDARIEVRAGTELDEFLRVQLPVRYRHEARNPEIAGDVEHPQAASGLGKLDFQITDVGIVELAQVHFRPLQSIVPPDRVAIPLDELEESLNDRLREGVAGGAAVGTRVELVGSPLIEETKEAGGKIFDPPVAQRPDRRPFDRG